MSPKPFKRSQKFAFNHDGPNQKALKDALDWIAAHDPSTPFSKLIQEACELVLTKDPPAPAPDESEETAPVSVEPPSSEPQPEQTGTAETGSQTETTSQKEVSDAPPSSRHFGMEGGRLSDPSRESEPEAGLEAEEIAAQIRSFTRTYSCHSPQRN